MVFVQVEYADGVADHFLISLSRTFVANAIFYTSRKVTSSMSISFIPMKGTIRPPSP